jgi:nitroreductase
LLPWRLVLVPPAQRADLAEVFAQALRERDPAASETQCEQAREKAFRAPRLLLLVVNEKIGDPEVDLHERLISAGAAVQNVMLVATAQGFGSALTSGKALKSQALRQRFGLGEGEHAVCFLSIGTVRAKRPGRPRPAVADYLTSLNGTPDEHHLF